MTKDMGASAHADRAVVNGAADGVSAVPASVPSAEPALRYEMHALASDGTKHPPHPGASRFQYGPWRISRADWIRPDPAFDWDWWHEDFDGAEDAGDNRCGSARSRDACLEEIHEWEDDQ